MAYEHREGSGSLFKNKSKNQENQPDYRGDFMLNGELHEIAAWVKEGSKGKFFSLSVKPKQEQGGGQRKPKQQPQPQDDDEDEIPF